MFPLWWCYSGIEQGIDPYQLMKIGRWKSADVFFNHYVASRPPASVTDRILGIIIPAADHKIPPNSSDSSVLPAGADDTISRGLTHLRIFLR